MYQSKRFRLWRLANIGKFRRFWDSEGNREQFLPPLWTQLRHPRPSQQARGYCSCAPRMVSASHRLSGMLLPVSLPWSSYYLEDRVSSKNKNKNPLPSTSQIVKTQHLNFIYWQQKGRGKLLFTNRRSLFYPLFALELALCSSSLSTSWTSALPTSCYYRFLTKIISISFYSRFFFSDFLRLLQFLPAWIHVLFIQVLLL